MMGNGVDGTAEAVTIVVLDKAVVQNDGGGGGDDDSGGGNDDDYSHLDLNQDSEKEGVIE